MKGCLQIRCGLVDAEIMIRLVKGVISLNVGFLTGFIE